MAVPAGQTMECGLWVPFYDTLDANSFSLGDLACLSKQGTSLRNMRIQTQVLSAKKFSGIYLHFPGTPNSIRIGVKFGDVVMQRSRSSCFLRLNRNTDLFTSEITFSGVIAESGVPFTNRPPLHSHQEMNRSDIDSAFSAGTVH